MKKELMKKNLMEKLQASQMQMKMKHRLFLKFQVKQKMQNKILL